MGIVALLFLVEAICAPLNLGPIQTTEHHPPDAFAWGWSMGCVVFFAVFFYLWVDDNLWRWDRWRERQRKPERVVPLLTKVELRTRD